MRDIGDVRLELAAASAAGEQHRSRTSAPASRVSLAIPAAVVAGVLLGGMCVWFAAVLPERARTIPTRSATPLSAEIGLAAQAPLALLYGRFATAFAAPFDLERLEVTGPPVPIATGVWTHSLYAHLQLAVSATGVLVYVPGGDVGTARAAWVGRGGEVELLPLPERVYGMFDLDRDGRRLALHVPDSRDYILIYDIEQRTERRVAATGSAGYPRWSPAGDVLAYTSFGPGAPYQLVVRRIDSDEPPTVLAEAATRLTPMSWSPDGRRLTFYEFPADRIGAVSFEADGTHSLEYLTFSGNNHALSADGRWLAYSSAGINVKAWPVDARLHKIADTGIEPRWCPQCDELIYRVGNRWFSVPIRIDGTFEWEPPRMVLQTQFNDTPGPSWLPSSDGQRILVLKRDDDPPQPSIRLMQDWGSASVRAQ